MKRFENNVEVWQGNIEILNNRVSSVTSDVFNSDTNTTNHVRYEYEYDSNLNLISRKTYVNNNLMTWDDYTYYESQNPFYNQLNSIYISRFYASILAYSGYNYPYNPNNIKKINRNGYPFKSITYRYLNDKLIEMSIINHGNNDNQTIVKYEY